MTNESILKEVNNWAESCGITIEATKHDHPPGLLDLSHLLKDDEENFAGPGIHIFIELPGPDDYIEFWIQDNLKNATYSFMEDGEGATSCIQEFAEVEGLLVFVRRQAALFLLRNIHLPATDEWLYDHLPNYNYIDKPKFCSEVAFHAETLGLQDWHFFEFQDASGYDITLGISGLGEVATFRPNEQGLLRFDKRGSKLSTAASLTEWLEKNLILSE
jgi:hypothetical protein